MTICKSHHKRARIKKQKLTSIPSHFYPYRRTNAQSLLLEINIWPPPPISCHWSLFITLRKSSVVWNKLPIYVQTSQNGQTHSYNLSAAFDKLFTCVWSFCGVGALRDNHKIIHTYNSNYIGYPCVFGGFLLEKI